ncbi:WDR20 family WD repeat protein [Schizosaccharomyces cryophilus OY26]|uniref:WDR20 family WD repeat protein n=1 Tax=Schizosaccharomyces cryophilus (strain OY26 / ATCC MYA-4695 / CBS 11777 / NBRC 106824 / NRRL Y48691) TaxID=653667 RepID=S9X9K2_SCHCR|nr:WDR20 family WD repeat protein [Schizosaccharomyces cryophilus OY26]EPY50426.1 WDR20 family WD repeat protein [Schizosaccharomyces cryophilus OY26]
MSSSVTRPVLFIAVREGEYVLKEELQLISPSQKYYITGSPLDPNTPIKIPIPVHFQIVSFPFSEHALGKDYLEELRKIPGVHYTEEGREAPSILENYKSSKRKSYTYSSSSFKLYRPSSRPGSSTFNPKCFISSITFHENIIRSFYHSSSLHKTYAFANHEESFYWLDLSTSGTHSTLLRMDFHRSRPVSHHINEYTKTPKSLEIVIGFDTGDVMWYDPINYKYLRYNKNGHFNNSPVTTVQWLPNQESVFLVSFQNGWIIFYDKNQQEQPLYSSIPEKNLKSLYVSSRGTFNVLKDFPSPDDRKPQNPIACIAFSNSPINAFSISPDHQHLAVVSERGTLKFLMHTELKMLDIFHSYFGGLSCVTWSPDGKFVVTGGKDDMLSVYSFPQRKLVARCQGHKSWVMGITFDQWRCSDDSYRIASVGLDRQLLLWDFLVTALHRPKSALHYVNHHAEPSKPTMSDLDDVGDLDIQSGYNRFVCNEITIHPTVSRSLIPIISPITSYTVDDAPATSVVFQPDCMITCSLNGRIRVWQRP